MTTFRSTCVLLAICFTTSLAGSAANCSAAEKPFTHPGILHSRAELDFVKAKVAEGEEPWKSAWEELRSHDISELDWKPKPVADVVRGVRNNPDIGGTNLMRDGAAAYSHAIQWYVTGKQPHADKAIEILNAYATTLKSIGGHDARLLAGMAGITFTNAAEILRHTGAGWSEPDQEQFRASAQRGVLCRHQGLLSHGERQLGRRHDSDHVGDGRVSGRSSDVPAGSGLYLSGNGNGAIGKYFNEFGECQESGRDQAHTQMGLGYLGCAAEIAWKQGVDLYGALDNRLALGFEYTAKYNLGHDVPYEPYRSHEGRYHYPKISDKSRGRFSSIYERVYHHYHDRMGLEMPFTAQVIEKIRPERWRSSHASWGTLMHAGQPAN